VNVYGIERYCVDPSLGEGLEGVYWYTAAFSEEFERAGEMGLFG
jgi:hypothetical protein